jgi:hypothetical protein
MEVVIKYLKLGEYKITFISQHTKSITITVEYLQTKYTQTLTNEHIITNYMSLLYKYNPETNVRTFGHLILMAFEGKYPQSTDLSWHLSDITQQLYIDFKFVVNCGIPGCVTFTTHNIEFSIKLDKIQLSKEEQLEIELTNTKQQLVNLKNELAISNAKTADLEKKLSTLSDKSIIHIK